MTLREMIRRVAPPVVVDLARKWRGAPDSCACGLSGDFGSWDEARAASTGYESPAILQKTKTALLKVKSGQAAYERDSVLFDREEYSWPLLAGLLWSAARAGGRLKVLDVGGSLGSTYFQNRAFIDRLTDVRWSIVEQPAHVAAGKELFESEQLRFYESIEASLADTTPDVALLSGVLQYLEHPRKLLEQLQELACSAILIDRTPFWCGPADRLCVQTVPPAIYPASYPSWIFSRERFHSCLREGWRVMVTYDNPDKLPGPVDFSYQGMILVRSPDVS